MGTTKKTVLTEIMLQVVRDEKIPQNTPQNR